jgi:Ca-activated chloride channel family protein
VQRFLLESQIGFAGQETAIGDAIGLAAKRLRERPASNRVLILLTDGQDTASTVDPLEASQLAAQLGIRIYTIGIGADSLTLPGLLGSPLGARTVNPSADLDEQTLQQIAANTGGQYFRARDPQELANIYQLLELARTHGSRHRAVPAAAVPRRAAPAACTGLSFAGNTAAMAWAWRGRSRSSAGGAVS